MEKLDYQTQTDNFQLSMINFNFQERRKTAMPGKFDFFWMTMELCDWRDEWNDEKVLRPVIRYLSKQDDQIIFLFDDLMTELLYGLDTKKLAEQCEKVDPLMCDDTFLYEASVVCVGVSPTRESRVEF